MNITGVILCGGKSSRMGFDKTKVKVKGEYLINLQIEKLKTVCGSVILITDKKQRVSHISDNMAYEDLYENAGPLGAIQTALFYADTEKIFVIGCDMPNICAEHVELLYSACQGYDCCIPKYDDFLECLYSVYDKSMRHVIENSLKNNEYQISKAVGKSNHTFVYDIPKCHFTNYNYKKDISTHEPFAHIPVRRYSDGWTDDYDCVVTESYISVYINGNLYITIAATNQYIKHLAVGHLYADGIIRDLNDIESIVEDRERLTVHIHLYNKRLIDRTNQLMTTGFGKGTVRLQSFDNLSVNNANVQIDPARIIKQMNEFSSRSELFKNTGGVHSALLIVNDDTKVFMEDIGRHNAIDKIVGHIILNESIIDENSLLLTTGRISSEIVAKASKIGLRVLVSRSAPTLAAIETASRANISLIGFARGKSFNQYV